MGEDDSCFSTFAVANESQPESLEFKSNRRCFIFRSTLQIILIFNISFQIFFYFITIPLIIYFNHLIMIIAR